MDRIFTTEDKIKVIAEFASYLDSLEEGKRYRVTVKEHRKRRSLDANAYAWVLLDKLAVKIGKGKEELYREFIKDVGGNSDTVCVLERAAERLCTHWSTHGLGWITDTVPSKIPGCVNVVLYCGSSVYDTAQMARLIDLIVQECQTQGVETKDPEELERLVKEWGGKGDAT